MWRTIDLVTAAVEAFAKKKEESMSENNQEPDLKSLHQASKQTVEEGVEKNTDIEHKVRELTLEALQKARLDLDEVRAIIQAILEGAVAGADVQQARMRRVLGQVVAGIEGALLKLAEASKLAIQEASGRIDEFASQDVKKAMADLRALEELFLQTLFRVARQGNDVARQTLDDLASHASRTGTSIGQFVEETWPPLTRDLQRAGIAGLELGANATKLVTRQLAMVISGFLSGLAATLRSEEERPRSSTEKSSNSD